MLTSTEAKLSFPVLCFTTEPALWGAPDLNILTTCSSKALKDGVQDGMEIIDAKGRAFRVTAARRVGRNRALIPWLLLALLRGGGLYRVEQALDPLPSPSLDEIKDRICALMTAHPENWDDHDLSIGHQMKKVRAAKTVRRLYDLAVIDDFRGY